MMHQSPQVSSAMSPIAPFFPSQRLTIIVSDPSPSLQLPSKRQGSPLLWGAVTSATAHAIALPAAREDGRNLSCMFSVTICFRKQEMKQKAFAAPSVSSSHAAKAGLQPAAAIANGTESRAAHFAKHLKTAKWKDLGQDGV